MNTCCPDWLVNLMKTIVRRNPVNVTDSGTLVALKADIVNHSLLMTMNTRSSAIADKPRDAGL